MSEKELVDVFVFATVTVEMADPESDLFGVNVRTKLIVPEELLQLDAEPVSVRDALEDPVEDLV